MYICLPGASRLDAAGRRAARELFERSHHESGVGIAIGVAATVQVPKRDQERERSAESESKRGRF